MDYDIESFMAGLQTGLRLGRNSPVMVMTADGFQIEKKSAGKIADLPDPKPVEETNEPE